MEFLSTPSARRATIQTGIQYNAQLISIHALREEGDPTTSPFTANLSKFLSTPSARRATQSLLSHRQRFEDFYPRPPRGGRPVGPAAATAHNHFYPRPPRGGRLAFPGLFLVLSEFLSTPSARRATPEVTYMTLEQKISIHALREEGDQAGLRRSSAPLHISIHALREEGDLAVGAAALAKLDFYPRPPRGGRLVAASAFTPLSNFYPRPPRGGRPADRRKPEF